jgi:hypothetical protein
MPGLCARTERPRTDPYIHIDAKTRVSTAPTAKRRKLEPVSCGTLGRYLRRNNEVYAPTSAGDKRTVDGIPMFQRLAVD